MPAIARLSLITHSHAPVARFGHGPGTLDGTAETVVWDFTTPGEVHRKAFKATLLSSEWVARGLPIFTKTMQAMPSGQDAVRIRALDGSKLAIDEIIVPRPHA